MTGEVPPEVEVLLTESVNRADALTTLRAGPRDRRELMSDLGVSRTTIHRVLRSLEDLDLVEQSGSTLELTAFGRTVATRLSEFLDDVSAAHRLKPLIETFGEADVDFDVSLFRDATVTTVSPTNPYEPVRRFMELLRASESLRGFDTTTVAPVFVEEIRNQILGGMETEILYLPETAAQVAASYPEEYRAAVDSGSLTVLTDEALPFGLALFEDRVGVGGYDDETGMLRVFVDTDDPEAYAWGESLFERYRERATPFTEVADATETG